MKRITRTLATASQLILAAPVRLPPKVIAIAKYVSLGAALLDALGNGQDGSALKGQNLPPPSGMGTGDRDGEVPGHGR